MRLWYKPREFFNQFLRKRKALPVRTRDDAARRRRSRPGVELLEDRTLLSVSPLPTLGGRAVANPGTLSVINRLAPPLAGPTLEVSPSAFATFVSSQPAVSNVVIIDSGVPDSAALLHSLGDVGSAGNGAAAPAADPMLQVTRIGTTDVVQLSPGENGVQEITDVLQSFHGLASEQLVSHGGPGEMLLGSTVLDRNTLQQDQAQIATWGQALRAGGDILLYGCDVAQGSVGAQFVDELARMTGAPVAANTQATGGSALGGTWDLDYRTGAIEAPALLTTADAASYPALLGVGTDLATYFQDLLASRSASFSQTETISNASIGNFLQLGTVTLTENATLSSSGVWSGTIGIAATSATLFPGSSFSAALTSSTPNQPVLTGTFTIGSTSGADFSLTVPASAALTINLGEALTITASNIQLSYDSHGSDSQTLATIQTATATSTQFSGMPSATLSNFAVRADGFSFDAFNLKSTSPNPGIGSFLTTTGADLTVSAFNVSFGTQANPTPSLSGTVGITVSGLQLFPAGQYVQLQTSSVAAAYSFANFDGIHPTGQLSVTITGFQLSMGQALQLSAPGSVVLTPDQAVLATIPSLTLSSPEFSGLGTLAVNNLQIQQTGFSLGNLSWNSGGAVSLGGGSLQFAGLGVTVSNLALDYAAPANESWTWSTGTTITLAHHPVNLPAVLLTETPSGGGTATTLVQGTDYNLVPDSSGNLQVQFLSGHTPTAGATLAAVYSYPTVSGSISFTGTGAVLFPNVSLLDLALGSLSGSFDFGTSAAGLMHAQVPNLSIPLGDLMTINLGTVDLTPGQTVMLHAPNVSVSANLFGGLSVSLPSFDLTQTGFSLSGVDFTINTPIDVGNFMQLSSLAIDVSSFAVDIHATPKINATVTITPGTLTLFPGITGVTSTFTGLKGSYDFSGTNPTGQLTFTVGTFSLSLFDQLSLSANQVTFTPGLSTLATIGSASLTFAPLNNLGLTVTNLAINRTGFTIASATANLPSNLSLGGLLTLTAPTVTLTDLDYTLGGTLSGTVGMSGGASLAFGSALDASVSQATGTYNLATRALSVTLSTFDLNVAGFADVSAAGVTLSYDPQASFTESATPNFTTTASLVLQHAALADSLVVTATPSGGGTTVTLTLGTDYTLTTDSHGNTQINFQLTAGNFAGAGIAAAGTAITASYTYTPPPQVLVGATGIDAFMGTGTGANRVGVDLTGGTLGAVIFNNSGTITYALDVTGTANLLGLPTNTIRVTPGAVEFRKNTAGAVSLTVPVGATTVPLNFTGNETDALAKGFALSVSTSAGTFASLSGDFGFSEFTSGTTTYLGIGGENITATVAAGGVAVNATGASLALVIDTSTSSNYALVASGGTDSLTGVPGLTLSGTGLTVRVRHGLDASTLTLPSGVITPDGMATLDFSNLGAGTSNITDVEGTATLTVNNFVTITGGFGFQQFTDGQSTYLAVGASNLNVVLGTATTNLTLTNFDLGLVIEPGTSATTYALEATGSSAVLNGVPDLSLTASNIKVLVRHGLDVTGDTNLPTSVQTPNGAVTLDLTDVKGATTNLTDIEANATLTVAGFVTLSGAFGFQSSTDTTTGAQQIAIGATNLTAVVGTSTTNVTLSGASLGLIIEPGSGSAAATYALDATATSAGLNGVAGLSLSATNLIVKARSGLDLSAERGLPVVHTSGGNVTLDFSELGTGTTDLYDLEGNVTLTVANFVTLSGPFGLQVYTTSTDSYLALGMDGSVTMTDGSDSLVLPTTSVGVLVHQDSQGATTYALEAREGNTTTTFNGPGGLSLSASNLLVLADRGLDVSTYPSGVPTSVALPAVLSAPTTESATPDFSTTLTITLAQDALAGSVVVKATPASGSVVTLTAGTDYTLATDTHGNTTVTFLLKNGNFAGANVTAAGATISTTYTYVVQPASTLTFDFGGLPTGGTNITEIEGHGTFSVAGFVSVSGDFGVELYTPANGNSTILIGARNVNAVLGTADTNLTISNATLGMMVQNGHYALDATGGTVALNGVPNLTLTANSLEVQVEKGLDPSSVTGAPTSVGTPGGTVSLSGLGNLGSTDITTITGNATITVSNFASLTGTFSFSEASVADADGNGTTTKLLVGASNASATLSANGVGVQLTGASFGLAIYRDSEATGSAYALQATAPSITALGLPSELSLSGSATVAINTTGAAVNETIGGNTISFADGTQVKSFGGTLTLAVTPASGTSYTLSGDFSFTKTDDGTTSRLLVGASNIATPAGDSVQADGGSATFTLSGGTLGMVFYTDDKTGTSLGYALDASATATATAGGGSLSAGATLTIRRNTTTSAQNDTVQVGAVKVPVVFSASEVSSSGKPFQTIAVSNASLNFDNGLIIMCNQGSASSPVANASSTNLTGVTLTLQDPSTTPPNVLFTVSAGTAVYTSFSGPVTASAASNAGLPARQDGQSWNNGDIDLELTNISFTIGSYVSFSADSVDVQHYTTSGGAVVDAFLFGNATITFLNNGTPMASLTGSPVFHYTSGSNVKSQNGFFLDSFANPGFAFLGQAAQLNTGGGSGGAGVSGGSGGSGGGSGGSSGTVHTLGPVTLVNPSVSLSNFSFDFTGAVGATITLSASTATIGTSSSPISATFTTLTGSFDLGLQFNLSNLAQAPTVSANNFSVSAASLSIQIGSYLTLAATNVTVNPAATATQDLVNFSSLSATLNVGAVAVTGTASNFAIEGDGSFLAKPDFGVSITLGQNDASNMSWPTWLPLKSASVTLEWANFNADPSSFLIELSASIDTTIAGMTVSGSVTNAVIDPNLVAAGQFAITSVDGLAVGVSGNLFGGTVSGQLIGGIVRFDANGNVVDALGNLTGTTTPGTGPFTSAFYAGIEGGFNLEDMAGFNIRVGLSQWGPLQVYVEADVPIPLGDTGLFLSDFRGGITFGSAFPTVNLSTPPQASDALQLGGSAFSAPDSLTADQWQQQLVAQVAHQYHSGQTGSFSFPTNGPFIIQAGLTLYAANPDAFKVSGDVFFDTTGNFLVIGTATVGDSLSVGVKVYANLAPLFAGQTSVSILFLMESPAQPNPEGIPPVYQVYGFTTFSDTNNVFQMTIAGEADFNLMNQLKAEATATLTLTFSGDAFNLTLSNGTFTVPQIQSTPLGTVDGSLTVQNNNGTIDVWGGFLMTTSLTALNPEGIYTSAQVFVKLNTTSTEQSVTLSNGTLALDPQSFSLYVNGVADFHINNQVVFELSGTLTFQIAPTNLELFVQAQLLLGSDPTNPLLVFNANGLIDIEDPSPQHPFGGLAAKLALTQGANTSTPTGVTFGENWLLVMNTLGSTVTYTIPDPVVTNPPSPPVPTVMGPDYNSNNPLALTSYETVVNGARTLVIPSGAPAGELSNYSNWTPVNNSPYLIVLGRGSVDILNSFTLTGNLNVLASVGSSGVSFTLDANAALAVDLNGNTVFSFQVAGGLQISNNGVAAALAMQFSNGFTVPSSLGFNLNSTFELEINTTSQNTTLAGINLAADTASIQATGDLTMLGGVLDLNGSFGFTVNSNSLVVTVNSTVTFLNATFTADGTAAIYYDSNPGLALDINLALPGGASGIAPISALGDNFVISGAFELQVNTCSVTRNNIAPGFQVAVNNLGVYLYGFNLTGSVQIGITSAGFGFNANLSLDLFGCATIGINGYYHPDGSFSFTGSAGFQFGDHIFGVGGSISLTVSNAGFGTSVSGWAAAFGLEIDASGSLVITGSSVDISATFQVTIVPAINIDTPSVDCGLFTIPGIHIHTPAVVVSKTATYHLGSISPPPVVATVNPPAPPPTPPHLAGYVTDNNLNALELYIGQDVSNRVNDDNPPVLTGAQAAENYTLTRVSGDPGSTNGGETIVVSALNFQQTYTNVQEILVHNTLTGNDTISIVNAIATPVSITLGSGNNTITTGSGPATIDVTGNGYNTITSGDHANITVESGAAGNNQITAGNFATLTVSASGSGSNQFTAGGDANVTLSGNENSQVNVNSSNADAVGVTIDGSGRNVVNVTGGTATVTIAGGASGNNSVLVNSSAPSTFNIPGSGNNTVSSLGSGAATITVTGNGQNQITTGGTSSSAASTVYLQGSGNNEVSTGAGVTNIYDQGTGGNTIAGGAGGGTYYYGADASGSAYSSKGSSYLTTSKGNFSVVASGYASYQLSDYNLAAGSYNLGLVGVRSVTLNGVSGSANTFTLAGWSANATVNGAGSNNTLNLAPNPATSGINDVLTDSGVQVTGGATQTINLSDVQTANLAGSTTGSNNFDVSGWSGNGSVTGQQGSTNTVWATNDADFTLSNSLLQRTGHGDLSLSGIQTANLTGGPSANTFTVNNWSGNATLDGTGGDDTYNLTLTGTGTGTINVSDSGANDTDTLNVTASGTTFVTATNVRVGTQRVNYGTSGIEILNVIGGAANLTYNVQSTNPTVATTVRGTGNANINVSSTAGMTPFTPGNLNGIQGALTIVGGSGASNRLRINDLAGTTSKTVTVTNGTITGLAPVPITYSAAGSFTDSSGTNDGIDLQGSSSASTTFIVQSTLAGSTTEVDGGNGNDVFDVWQASSGNNVAGIQGMLTINAGGGADNRLIVDNSGATADQTVTLRNAAAAGYQAITGLAPAEVDYTTSGAFADPAANDGILFSLAATPASVGGTINVQTTLGGSTTRIVGGSGNDTFVVTRSGSLAGINGMLSLDAAGGTDNRLIVDNSAATADQNVTLSNATASGYQAITGLAPAEIDYRTNGAFADATANSNDGILLSIAGTRASVGSTVNVQTTLAGSTTRIIGGNGNDTFNITNGASVAGILGMLTVDAAGGAYNRLIVDNSAASADQTVTLNNAAAPGYQAITGLAPAEIDYKTSNAFADPTANRNDGILLSIAGNKASVGSTINVQTTLAGSTTRIVGGNGNDTFNVSNGGLLAGVDGMLTLDAAGGADNRLVVDNSGATADQNVTLGNAAASGYQAITGLAPAEIDYRTSAAFADPSANDGILLSLAATKASVGSTINVQATLGNGSTTQIIGGNGNDTFNVTNSGSLAGIRGMLTIDAAGGADNRLIANNSSATADQSVTLGNATASGYQAILGLAPVEIDYKTSGAFADPVANSNDGILLTVAGTPASVGSTINVQTTLAGSTTKVVGGSGSDVFNVGQGTPGTNNLAGIQGMLTVDAGAGSDNRLIVDDSGATADQNVTLGNAAASGYQAITGLAPVEIDYRTSGAFADPVANSNDGIRLSVAATPGSVGSTVNVQTTLGGSTTKIIGGNGNDAFNVWQTAVGNILTGIQGMLTVDAAGGTDNRLIVDNSGATADQTVTLNYAAVPGYQAITGLAPAEIDYRTSAAFADPAAADGILLSVAGTKANVGSTINVQATLGNGSTTKILGGNGNDLFNVGTTANSLGAILGNLTIDGQGNSATPTNTVSCQNHDGSLKASQTLAVGDTVNFNDQGDNSAGGFVYNLTSSTLDRSGLPQPSPDITYHNLETINLNTALQASTVNVASTVPNADTTITGSINATPTGDTINVASTGAGSIVNVLAGTGDSTINLQSTGQGSFTNLRGNGGNDAIDVSSTAGTSARGTTDAINGTLCIDAGAGNLNRLTFDDFSGTLANNNVVLNSDTITGLAPATIFYGATGGHYLDATPTTYDGITVFGADGHASTFNIQSTLLGSSTLVQGGSHNDTFNVGKAGSLGLIQGNLALDGLANDATPTTTLSVQSGDGKAAANNTLPSGDTVNFNDQADNTAGGFTYTLTANTLDRSGLPQVSPAITYANLETVNLNTALEPCTINVPSTAANVNTTVNGSINATATGDTFNVTSTGAGSSTTFNGGTGATAFNLENTGAGSFTRILGQGASDTVLVSSSAITGTSGNVDGINAALVIDAAGGTNNRLTLDDTTGAVTTNVIVHYDYITGLGAALPTIFYAATGGHYLDTNPTAYDGILINGSDLGGNTFNVESTLGGSTTSIVGDGGNADYFNIYSDAAGSGPGTSDASSNLLGIQGKLTVVGGSSSANRLVVSDKGDNGTSASNVNLSQIIVTDHSLLNFAPAFIYYSAPAGHFTDGTNPDGIWLQGSLTAPNTFLAYSTLAASTVQIDGGAANDSFNFGARLAADVANPDTADTTLPATLAMDQGDLNYLQGAITVNGNGGADSIEANDHGKLYTVNGVVQYAVNAAGNPLLPLTPLHVNEDGAVPATSAPAASLAKNPNYQYTRNDTAYGYDYLVTPNTIANDPTIRASVPVVVTPPARTFAGIAYNTTGASALDTVTLVRVDGTDRTNRFHVIPDTKNVTTFMIDGNMGSGAARKDGGDYLDLDTTPMGAPGSAAVFSRTLHIFTGPRTFAGTTDGTAYYPDLEAAGAGDATGTTVPAPKLGTALTVYKPTTPGVDSGELASATGNGFWSFVRNGQTFARPVYFLSIDTFNHVAIVAQVSTPAPNSSRAPYVTVRDAETGDVKWVAQPYESYFHGGLNVAVGDLNGDGIPDLVTMPEQGHTPVLNLYNGTPNAFGKYGRPLLNTFKPFAANFLGGGSVAIGDTNYDGYNDLVVGAGVGYVPIVEVYNGKTVLQPAPTLIKSFYAYTSGFGEALNQNFKGGVNVAVGDLNNDGFADIVAAPASNGSPLINVFNGKTLTLLRGFYAFNASNVPGGLRLAVGDVTGDGMRDIVVGSSPGYVPVVAVFSGATVFTAPVVKAVQVLAVAPSNFRGAITVQTAPTDGGHPGFVELQAVFATLTSDQQSGDLTATITAFSGGR